MPVTTTKQIHSIQLYNDDSAHTKHKHMFSEGTDRENNKKPYFPVTRGSALDNGGCMNSATQSIHGASNRMVEDA